MRAKHGKQHKTVQDLLTLVAALMASCSLTGCLMVGGSSRGGFFIWPGSIGLLVIILIVSLLLRRR